MRPPEDRWLALLLALLAGLTGIGLHEATHAWDGSGAVGPPTGRLEVHAGDCEHRGEAGHHPPHACLVCKVGGSHGPLLAADAPSVLEPPDRRQVRSVRLGDRRAEIHPGSLGARAPPHSRV
jgi:hypothetical protein